MKLLYLFITAACATFLIACGKELTENTSNEKLPVVEAYIMEGTNTVNVKVYSMEVYLGEDYILSLPIKELQVYVNDILLTEGEQGNYYINLQQDTVKAGQIFSLHFLYNGVTVTAETTIPNKIENLTAQPNYLQISTSSFWYADDTTTVNLHWDNIDQDFYQVYTEAPDNSSITFPGGNRRQLMQPTQGNSYQLSTREFRSIGKYTITVYKVLQDYNNLFQTVASNDLANPISNINNALGIFTGVSKETVTVNVTEAE
jgi:hypothetical protein